MNEDERDRFLAALRTDDAFRAAVRREVLTEELLNLPQVVAHLTATVHTLVDTTAGQRRDIATLTETVSDLAQTVSDLAQTVHVLVDTTAEQRRDIVTLTETVQGVAQGVADYMAQTNASLEAFRAAMLDGFNAMREGFARTEDGLARMETRMENGFAAVQAKFDQVDAELRDIRNRLD